jgi:RNA polymerase sigma-70 factor (ECF subfamily)
MVGSVAMIEPVPPIEAGAPDDERALLERLRKGHDGAFEQLVRDTTPRLLAVARRITGNDEDARDAVQDGFISAFRALAKFEGQSRLSTWLHRIVVNASLMRLRAKRLKPEESIEDLLPVYDARGYHVDEPPAWDTIQLEDAGKGDDAPPSATTKLVREALDRLPETYRTVLLLRDIEGLDTQETADTLGVTPNAVKIRLHRARQAFKSLVEREFGGSRS